MNYIALINSFWDFSTINPLSTGQVSLYFALLHICNRSNWTEWFQASNQVLSVLTGLSRSGILKARNELKQKRLIDFKERGTKATLYKLITDSKQNSVQDSTQEKNTIANSKQDSTQNSKQDSIQDGVQNSRTLYKQKQKQNLEKSITNVIPEKSEQKRKAQELFERLWRLYPNKKGKGQVSDTQKQRLLAVGESALVKAIERYSTELQKDASWRKPQNGSTFFNGGYVDYLDENYTPGEENSSSDQSTSANSSSKNRFHNFDQSQTDYDALVMQKLQARMAADG